MGSRGTGRRKPSLGSLMKGFVGHSRLDCAFLRDLVERRSWFRRQGANFTRG